MTYTGMAAILQLISTDEKRLQMSLELEGKEKIIEELTNDAKALKSIEKELQGQLKETDEAIEQLGNECIENEWQTYGKRT